MTYPEVRVWAEGWPGQIGLFTWLHLTVEEGLPEVDSSSWPTALEDLAPAVEAADKLVQRDSLGGRAQVVLARVRGCLAHLRLISGNAWCLAAGPDRGAVGEALALIREAVPEPRHAAEVQWVPLTVWHFTERTGGIQRTRAGDRGPPLGGDRGELRAPNSAGAGAADGGHGAREGRAADPLARPSGGRQDLRDPRPLGQGLSRVLNPVDGLVGQGLRILMLVTTNEPLERVHPAVPRPGRCGAPVEFRELGPEEVEAWFASRGAAVPDGLAGAPATIAALQAALDGRVPEGRRPVGFLA